MGEQINLVYAGFFQIRVDQLARQISTFITQTPGTSYIAKTLDENLAKYSTGKTNFKEKSFDFEEER